MECFPITIGNHCTALLKATIHTFIHSHIHTYIDGAHVYIDIRTTGLRYVEAPYFEGLTRSWRRCSASCRQRARPGKEVVKGATVSEHDVANSHYTSSHPFLQIICLAF